MGEVELSWIFNWGGALWLGHLVHIAGIICKEIAADMLQAFDSKTCFSFIMYFETKVN